MDNPLGRIKTDKLKGSINDQLVFKRELVRLSNSIHRCLIRAHQVGTDLLRPQPLRPPLVFLEVGGLDTTGHLIFERLCNIITGRPDRSHAVEHNRLFSMKLGPGVF